MDSVLEIYTGLSQVQKERLASKGIDSNSAQNGLKELLFNHANSFISDLRNKVKEEFIQNQKELSAERELLVNSIESQRTTMKMIGLLSEQDVEQSLVPLQNKLKIKIADFDKNEKIIQKLSPAPLVPVVDLEIEPEIPL